MATLRGAARRMPAARALQSAAAGMSAAVLAARGRRRAAVIVISAALGSRLGTSARRADGGVSVGVHPELMRVLDTRIGSILNFQRDRGVLRLYASRSTWLSMSLLLTAVLWLVGWR